MIETIAPRVGSHAIQMGSLFLQLEPGGTDVDITLGPGLAGGAVGTFVLTLVVGAILVAVAPAYTDRMLEAVTDDPVSSFLYGLFFFLTFGILTVALVITLVGIPVALVVAVLVGLAWYVGVAIAFLAIADRLVGHEDGWLVALLVAAGLNGLLTATGVGGLVALLVGITGFGAVVSDALD